MDHAAIRNVLDAVKAGGLSVEDAVKKLRHLPYEDIFFAKVDHHRHLRQGIPEVVFASGKTGEQVKSIALAMYKKSKRLLITKATGNIYDSLGIKDAVFYPVSG